MKRRVKLALLCASVALATPVFAALTHQYKQRDQQVYDVFRVDQFKDLKLFLKDGQHRSLKSFSAISNMLQPCESLVFAMNAGMYHADYSPVGLYIEQGRKIQALNTATGWGNFFMQPNGVLAWNSQKAVIQTTAQYEKSPFKAQYATQSGPMLVTQGVINPQFIADSDSLKIRNGVGIKNNQLYFVMSRSKVNFYDFAQFFKQSLNVQDALYLDGSISSIYSQALNRHDARYRMGPMLGLVERQTCK